MSMPIQKPGKSKQDYGTPPELIAAAEYLVGSKFVFDLAASAENTVCPLYYTEQINALEQPWHHNGWNWLNPPFAKITPWAKKALKESALNNARTAMLIPASIGSNWWNDYVFGMAQIFALRPRITFVGETAPYPKDCALLLYTPHVRGGYSLFNWQDSIL